MRKSLAFAMSFAAILVAPALRAQEQPSRLELPDGLHNRQNNFRLGAQIVLRFG